MPNTYAHRLLVTMRCKLHFNLNSDIINKTVVVESIATPLSVSGTKGSDDDDVRKKLALHGKKKKKIIVLK